MKSESNQNLSETDSEQKRQEAVARFKNLTEKPPAKQIWFKSKTVCNVGILLLIVAILGVAAYELGIHRIINVPGIHQHIEVLSTFDNNPPMNTIKNHDTGEIYYESNPIIIKAGVNAVPATQEDITNFQNQTPPIYEETPNGAHDPYINVIFPIDPENAESVQLIKSIVEDTHGNVDYPYHIIDNWEISIKGDGMLTIPLIEGARKVTAKVAVVSAINPQIDRMFLTYQLNDGREVEGILYFDYKNFIPTDILKSIPTYVPSGDSSIDDINPVEEFDLSQNPSIPLLHYSGSTYLGISLGTGQAGGGLSPVFETKNGKLLYSSIIWHIYY